MLQKIKESVATIFAHIIKLDHRDIQQSAPLFCELMGEDFDISIDEATKLLQNVLNNDYDINLHIDVVANALKNDMLSKYHLLSQLNRIIYSGEFSDSDYEFFEYFEKKLGL
jgi:methionine synthase II (cobalamin-independent)